MTVKHQILIADDDLEARGLWRKTLASWGYEVSFVDDGEKALALVERQLPDVLLCDLRIPRKNGVDLLRTMRERRLNLATFMLRALAASTMPFRPSSNARNSSAAMALD